MADKIPIFISYDDNQTGSVASYPYTNGPILVDAGSDFVNTFEVTNSNSALRVRQGNTVVSSDGRLHTVYLYNVQDPQFLIADVDDPALDPAANDPCCGIKSMRLSMQEDGSITGSLSGMKTSVYAMMDEMMKGAYRITSWREEGATTSITATSLANDAYEKIKTSAVFKTIPQDVYDLHVSGIITRSMQSPLEAPDSTIYIRSSNIYGTDGWTVQEILDILKIHARVPAAFNYHVYQLTISRGAPVISLIHNLLPIPGLVIERRRYSSGIQSLSRYYITMAKGTGAFNGNSCKVTGESHKVTPYDTTVIGMPGEPLYITSATRTITTAQQEINLNLIGGVFSVTRSATVVSSQSIV